MVVDDRKELLTRAEIMNRVYLRDIAKLDADIQQIERILAREISSSVSTLDDVTLMTFRIVSSVLHSALFVKQYSSAIQAEVIQLYAKLEGDPHQESVLTRNSSSSTWHLMPRCFDRLISRSCTVLFDSRVASQQNTCLIGNKRDVNRPTPGTNAGWGSVSCIEKSHDQMVQKQLCCHTSLITLLTLNADSAAVDESVYQLVDKSLLGPDVSVQRVHGLNYADEGRTAAKLDSRFPREIVLSMH